MLRWIIYFLLLINIGFIAWHYHGLATLRSFSSDEQDGDTPRLVLYREQQNQQGQAALCFNLGPFDARKEAEQVKSSLRSRSPVIRQDRDLSRDGYWVVLRGAKNRKEAQATVAQLKQNKLRDFFIISARENENAISLGVYSLRDSAERRMKQIQDLGMRPTLETVKIPRRVYWLEWHKQGSNPLDTSELSTLKATYPEIRSMERGCSAK